MSLPLVIIGIPVYNEQEYIGETIDSALAQDYENFIVFISDNCSTDNTALICESYQLKYPEKIRLFRQKANIGVVDNFKYLRDNSESDYFMWLGAHDLLGKTFISEAVNLFESSSKTSLTFPKAILVGKKGEKVGDLPNSEIKSDFVFERAKLSISQKKDGTPFHGLFKTSFIKQMPLDTKGADDVLILFLTSLEGNVVASNTVQYFRREIRLENKLEKKERYKSYGYPVEIRKIIKQRFIKEIINTTKLSRGQKIKLCLIYFRYNPDLLYSSFKIAKFLKSKI